MKRLGILILLLLLTNFLFGDFNWSIDGENFNEYNINLGRVHFNNSIDKILYIKNSGSDDLYLKRLVFTNNEGSNIKFVIGNNEYSSITVNQWLSPNDILEVGIRATPTDVETYSQTLEIYQNENAVYQDTDFYVEGREMVIPSSLDCGTRDCGTDNEYYILVEFNANYAPSIQEVFLYENDYNTFALSENLAGPWSNSIEFEMDPPNSKKLYIQFSPEHAIDLEGKIRIKVEDVPSNYYEINISGTGDTGLNIDYVAEPTEGYAPLDVHFNNLSHGYDNCSWDVDGDGEWDFTTIHCDYVYDEPGIYNPKLKIENQYGSEELTKELIINAPSLNYLIYSNIESEGQIDLYLNNQVIDVRIENFSKGWNSIKYENIEFSPDSYYIQVTADGVAGENYTIESSTNYVLVEGYYENSDVAFTFENKPLHSDWNWESFPKLARTNNNAVEGLDIFESIQPVFTDFQLIGIPNLDYHTGHWSLNTYALKSSNGMKILVSPSTDRVYLTDDNATRLSANTPVDLSAGWNWIGYWLPHSQMTDVAFGEHWENVKRIKAEDWYYDDMKMERGSEQLSIYSAIRPKPLHYGEGYYVYLYEPIDDFQWNYNSITRSENFVKDDPDNFTYEVKADYEAIEIVDIEPDIQEIGVYENGVCVGATKVQGEVAQILAYTDRMNRNGSELTFEIVSGRGNKQSIANYQVYKKNQFTKGYLQAGKQEFSIVKLGKRSETVSQKVEMKHVCYPNPYKLSFTRDDFVTISFEKIVPGKTIISVFNIKGQKINTILDGNMNAGKQNITWNLKNSNNKDVSSGIYFYKISEPENETTGKMILVK